MYTLYSYVTYFERQMQQTLNLTLNQRSSEYHCKSVRRGFLSILNHSSYLRYSKYGKYWNSVNSLKQRDPGKMYHVRWHTTGNRYSLVVYNFKTSDKFIESFEQMYHENEYSYMVHNKNNTYTYIILIIY